ncbi:hypothetical protein Poly24_03360 [Rosistilla carotiformis]|uniref:Secreted protein n=1 Tax=Rosistilla carotiformis TaxID=2528017 RepID=A0A518JM72_9BACT|nr:hypothetical protein [Rosistilla carotiformis]QDV66649.1 hypothetical protein Poly24_03360 [Rosistilla carotiformis]
MNYRSITLLMLIALPLLGCNSEQPTMTDPTDIEAFEQQVVNDEMAHQQQMAEEAKAANKK